MRKLAITMLLAIVALTACVKKSNPPLAIVGLQGGDTVRVAVGANFYATFLIREARNVYAIAAAAKYDTNYLSVMKSSGQIANVGDFLGVDGDLTSAFMNGIPGTIVFAYSLQGDSPGVDGEGELWKVQMNALRPGLTKIAFETSRCFVMSPNIVGNGLERLPARFDDKLIQIGDEAPPAEGDTSIIYIRIDQ